MRFKMTALVTAALLISSSLSASDDLILTQQIENLEHVTKEDKEFDMALVERGNEGIFYRVPIPKNYVIGCIIPARKFSIELIPSGESVEDWSEIMTLSFTEGLQQNMHLMLMKTKERFESDSPHLPILLSKLDFFNENGIQIGSYAYDGPHAMPGQLVSDTHNEMVDIYTVRGGLVIWSAQLAIKYPKNLSKGEKEKLRQKLKDFRGKVISRPQ